MVRYDKMFTAKTDFSEYDVYLELNEYVEYNNTCLSLWSDDVGPVATLTVNIDKLDKGFAYIDTNNCPWAEKFLTENGLAEPTGKFGRSGYCTYPLYKLNMEKICGQ